MSDNKLTNLVILNKTTDFTNSELVKYLNDKYGGKSVKGESTKPFNLQDIQQYVTKGFLPKKYGGEELKVIESNDIGIKIIRVNFDK